jgi:osmoprotectant transport system substrate-binding protein
VRAVLGAILVAVLLAAGCQSAPEPVDAPVRVVVGAGLSTEQQIVARMYAQALTKAGFAVTTRFDAGSRTAYVPALQRGDLDVVPDYLAPLTTYLRTGIPVGHRPGPATGDVEHTARLLDGLLDGTPLGVTRPSTATDQAAFAVPKTLADDKELADVSDLSRLNGQLVLAGPTGCVEDVHCLTGLQDRYGLRFRDVDELGEVSGPAIFAALRDGDADVGAVLSSSGGIAAGSLVVLRDDRLLQPAGNILALYRTALPAPARAVVDSVNRALTTEKLQEQNKRQDLDGQDPDDLAKRFLQDARLI